MLSEDLEESESLGWSSPTHCFSPLKGILCPLRVGKAIGPAQTNRPCVNILWYFGSAEPSSTVDSRAARTTALARPPDYLMFPITPWPGYDKAFKAAFQKRDSTAIGVRALRTKSVGIWTLSNNERILEKQCTGYTLLLLGC